MVRFNAEARAVRKNKISLNRLIPVLERTFRKVAIQSLGPRWLGHALNGGIRVLIASLTARILTGRGVSRGDVP